MPLGFQPLHTLAVRQVLMQAEGQAVMEVPEAVLLQQQQIQEEQEALAAILQVPVAVGAAEPVVQMVQVVQADQELQLQIPEAEAEAVMEAHRAQKMEHQLLVPMEVVVEMGMTAQEEVLEEQEPAVTALQVRAEVVQAVQEIREEQHMQVEQEQQESILQMVQQAPEAAVEVAVEQIELLETEITPVQVVRLQPIPVLVAEAEETVRIPDAQKVQAKQEQMALLLSPTHHQALP